MKKPPFCQESLFGKVNPFLLIFFGLCKKLFTKKTVSGIENYEKKVLENAKFYREVLKDGKKRQLSVYASAKQVVAKHEERLTKLLIDSENP